MMDALLHATKDALINGGLGYDARVVYLFVTGEPAPFQGDIAVIVHPGAQSCDSMNSLDERYGFSVTLTMRLSNVPLDRVGDSLLAKKVAEQTGFNGRAEKLKAFLHMAWNVLEDANNYLVQFSPDGSTVYGFCEPAHFASMEIPQLVGPEWFGSEPDQEDVGLKAELRFEGARRVQAVGAYV